MFFQSDPKSPASSAAAPSKMITMKKNLLIMLMLIPMILAGNQNQTKKGQEIVVENAALNETVTKSKDVNLNIKKNDGNVTLYNNEQS